MYIATAAIVSSLWEYVDKGDFVCDGRGRRLTESHQNAKAKGNICTNESRGWCFFQVLFLCVCNVRTNDGYMVARTIAILLRQTSVCRMNLCLQRSKVDGKGWDSPSVLSTRNGIYWTFGSTAKLYEFRGFYGILLWQMILGMDVAASAAHLDIKVAICYARSKASAQDIHGVIDLFTTAVMPHDGTTWFDDGCSTGVYCKISK